MKRIFTLILFLLVAKAFAGELPRAYAVGRSDAKYIILPDSCYQYLDVWKKQLTLNQVIKNGNKKLPETDADDVSVFNEGNYWAWYSLKNTSKEAYIVSLFTTSGKADVYVLDKGKWVHYQTGAEVPWSKKDGDKSNNSIPYTIEAGHEIVVYINEQGSHEAPRIGNFVKVVTEAYLDKNIFVPEHVITFGLAGFILFGMVFNLLFYYVSREKLYLVYSFLLFFAALTIADDALYSLYFKEHTQWYVYFEMFTGFGFIIMFTYTFRYFFSMKDYFPRWDKILTYLPIFLIVCLVFSLVLYVCRNMESLNYLKIAILIFLGLSGIAALILFLGFLVILIWVLIIFARRKDKEARLFTIAIVPFFASFVLTIMLKVGWITSAATVWAIIILSWGLFARYRDLQIENTRVALEKEEERNRLIAQQNELLEHQVAERTAELRQSLLDLQQTQAQLIQSEKMASLGELTAGIAHEIQNPLNFVNNFSDVSIELLEEMGEELDKGDTEEAKAIAADVKDNLTKIAHHGRRADSIVKGMLQHSRASSGQKEPTDINALADEYLRLAYHGLRAKDKSFNADLITHFSEGLPKVNMVPQDVGRVLLNLFTNAFYATQQKSKQAAGSSYKPAVEVSTQLKDNAVEIVVKDNGTGIPDTIKDKILQPFFTTKPTGEGTGLGLSLSYDIVVKAHGGTIDIESTEGEGAIFIINLPVNA